MTRLCEGGNLGAANGVGDYRRKSKKAQALAEAANNFHVSDRTLVFYLHILARLFFCDYNNLAQAGAALLSVSPEEVVLGLLTVWTDRFDCFHVPYKQKLIALALLNTLRVIPVNPNNPQLDPLSVALLTKLPSILASVSTARLANEKGGARGFVRCPNN